jgi:hypothetical protein
MGITMGWRRAKLTLFTFSLVSSIVSTLGEVEGVDLGFLSYQISIKNPEIPTF